MTGQDEGGPRIRKGYFMKIIINENRCLGSGECVKACPHGAISLKDGLAVVDHSLCDLDGLCIPACPHDAVGYSEQD